MTPAEKQQAKLYEYAMVKAHLRWLMKSGRCTGWQAIHCARDVRNSFRKVH